MPAASASYRETDNHLNLATPSTPDIVYYNFTSAGVSLQFTPAQSYRPPRAASKRSDLDESKLTLSTVDIYVDKFASFPISLSYIAPAESSRDSDDSKPQEGLASGTLDITRELTGKELVEKLGEPDRKGGGESRTVGVWLEWTGLGLMCEFSSIHGQGKWDKEKGAGAAPVGVWSFFEPGVEVGKATDDE